MHRPLFVLKKQTLYEKSLLSKLVDRNKYSLLDLRYGTQTETH